MQASEVENRIHNVDAKTMANDALVEMDTAGTEEPIKKKEKKKKPYRLLPHEAKLIYHVRNIIEFN
jgi:hypothetical protein